ncbi:MAG: DNA repair protein RecN [Bdellovibrionales bacterium]|nr:DNA repair protein RecN [Bdellovibrionales bacterium]
MITHLNIKGLAIIENLEIDFSSGFNVITGETGAGKSILILALHFLTGSKVSSDVVRSGGETASVAGEFLVRSNHPSVAALRELGIEVELEGTDAIILIRRQLSSKGRSQAWINDVAVSSLSLKEIGMGLIDIFAQHENQRLMNPQEHIRYLDQFSSSPKELREVHTQYHSCEAIITEMDAIINRVASSQRDRDYLTYRLEELKKFHPTIKDYQTIGALCESADKVSAEREILSEAVAYLETGDSNSVSSLLWALSKTLGKLGEPNEKIRARAESVAAELEDLHFTLTQRLAAFDVDESSLEEASGRQFGYQELFRKHNVKTVDELVEAFHSLEEGLGALESAKEKITDGINRLIVAVAELEKASKKLTDVRKKTAAILKKKVETEIHELSMVGARFDFEWVKIDRNITELSLSGVDSKLHVAYEKIANTLKCMGPSGAEKVHFLLSSNPGEPTLPLVKSASGGELSRIMLAIKKTLAADAETCVLVFDEIDTGISGSVADVVGRKMRELAAHFQVICISHLPQVAVYADTHCLVRKQGKKNRTETEIIRLSIEDSAKEIARLLSGRDVSPSSLAHAKNLMAQART